MKTFTRFFVLLFAFAIIGSTNTYAGSGWTPPTGDGGSPLLELWVYGVTLPSGSPEVGDEIAVFDGGTLVGHLTLTAIPSTATWLDCQIICYSKTSGGGDLYTPDNPFMIKYFDASAATTYNAWTWGDGNHIDFHDVWYAPTSDEAGATTEGAYFPSSGSSSYGYIDLTVTADPIPMEANVNITVLEDDGLTDVEGATITAGGYSATDNTGGDYDLPLYAGSSGDTDDYVYTVTVSKTGYTTETFSVTVTASAADPSVTVYLDGKGNITGVVKAYDLNTTSYELAQGALVSTTVDGITYSDYTDASGVYTINDIPDGDWDFVYSYEPDYVSQSFTRTIDYDGSTTTVGTSVDLDLKTGTLSGKIYNATTGLLITGGTGVKVSFMDGVTEKHTTTTTTGSYSLSYYGGTYDILVEDLDGNMDDYTFSDYVVYPDHSASMNFNLLPTGTTANYDPITGPSDKDWIIYIEMAKFGPNFLLPWDELVIFDTDEAGIGGEPGRRVGTLRFQAPGVYQNSSLNVLTAYSQLASGNEGFVTGHNIEFWAYDIDLDEEYGEPVNWFFNPNVGTYSDTVFPDSTAGHTSYLNIYWETPDITLSGTVSDNLGTVDDVLVEVLNFYTQDVITSTTTTGGGQYSFELSPSTYDVRFSKSGYTSIYQDDYEVLVPTELDVTLSASESITVDYVYGSSGFYFIGRAIEKASPTMLTLLDNNGLIDGNFDDDFSDDFTSSYVANDDEDTLYHDGSNWEPDFSGSDYQWDLDEGYQLYLEAVYDFDMSGYLVKPENNPITFPSAGEYYIPYFPFSASSGDWDDAIDAFAGIFWQLDWVMDSDGNKLDNVDNVWVDNIGQLDPSEGYRIKLNDAATLTYPASKKKSSRNTLLLEPEHFIYSGGNAAGWTYTIYINTDDFEVGDEIAAYSNGTMVGSMVIESSDNPWQNNLNTFNIAVNGGYEINSPIVLEAWDKSTGDRYDVIYEMVQINEGAYIGRNYPAGLDHYSYAEVTRGTVRVDKNHVDNNVRVYPNPTSTMLNIESVSNIKEVHLYNLYGALVDVVSVNAAQQTLDVSNYTAGTYMIQLHTETGVITKRVIIK